MTTARVEMSRDVEKPDGDRTPVVPSPAPATGIQLRGYLKKKRNRMGGWRKLYVVLQSQLLLSYASRRDYERRLAPFEDIINLVPGTRILPSAGLRFTIETNSRNFYTFRCVDHRNCSEWITALLDSLQQGGCNRGGGGGGGAIRDRQFGQPSPDHRTSSPVWASLSMELGLARVLHQTMEGKGDTRCAGRSGQRTKPTSRDEEEQQQQQQLVPFQRPALQATTPATVQEVAMPERRGTTETGREGGVAVVPLPKHERHHSDEACADEIITKAFQFLTRPKRSRDMTASEILEYYLERRHRSQQQEQTNDENEKGAKQSAVRRAAGVDRSGSGSSFNTRLETATTSQPLATEDTAATAEQQTRKLQQQEATAPVRFRDFRLHPDADRPITSVGRSQSVDVSRINSMFSDRQQQQQQQRKELRRGREAEASSPIVSRRPVAPTNLRDTGQRVSSSCSDLPPVMRWQLAAGTFVASISGPVVGPGASYMLRRASLERNAAMSGYEYISAHSSSSSSSSSTSSNSSSASTFASNRRIELIEPIYAVVDVKAKRFRRNQQQEQQEQQEQEQQELSQDERTRPNHHYEEAIPVLGPDRPMSEEATEQDDLPYDQQHIYEPIMIAAQPPTSTSVASTAATATGCEREHHWRKLWRNLKRIRLHPGRNRRQKEQPAGPNVTVVAVEQPSTDPSATSSTSCSSGSSSSSSNGSHQRAGLIAGLGSRLDSHRQSMKKRAKSLYDATSNAA